MEKIPKVRVILAKGTVAELQNIDRRELEPQEIKIRGQNSSNMFIDIVNRNNNLDSPPTNIRLSSRDNTLFSKNIVRIAVSRMSLGWITPNINERNNTIGFRSSNTGAVIHTVTIFEGFYTTRDTMMTALVLALNTATGASGLTFSYLLDVLNPICANLISVGGNYNFDVSSPMIVRGKVLFNLPVDQTLNALKKVGAIHGLYTRYISIYSNVLTQWTKNPNQSNKLGNNTLLFRLPTGPDLGAPVVLDEIVQNLVFINYKPDQDIVAVDFLLTDEFGDELYVPTCAEGTDSSFLWNITLQTQT